MPRLLFPLLLLGLPLAEIAGFVVVGQWLGLWPTLALVILSGLAGTVLLRIQGLDVLRQINAEGRAGRVPGEAIVHGALIVFGSILLVLPGFLTDIAGILLFIPGFRRLIWRMLGERLVVRSSYSARPTWDPGTRRGTDQPTLDLDANDYQRGPNPDSPWKNGPKDGA
ncbi:FxsA family protein [Rhizobium straminoryzae]|uniref:Membrane protein FxsA n=1 Tax=Rhizobium straminoryzae TaxID=1387186 RepID=A0A549SMJ9_9HYPH|nr:FxsA family protein [Rhizobium straminoryzae]TRL30859.1 membrane protein FxsA [Rhizobium straminoryzae]